MKNYIIIPTFFFISIWSNLFSQQGEYKRKSISSLESVWFKPNSISGLNFDSKTFDTFINFYLETERFDYNTLPKYLTDDFIKKANKLAIVDPLNISKLLEQTISNKILSILNDPEIINQRMENFKNESDYQSFAYTKGKSRGLNKSQLESLMNSAYIYLPYISSASSYTKTKKVIIPQEEKEKNKNSKKNNNKADTLEVINKYAVEINGGIIWWKMLVSEDGLVSIKKINTSTTKASSSYDPSSKGAKKLYNSFSFGTETWRTTPEQYIQNNAMLAFVKNLGIKTKEIRDFKLSSQIIEADKKKYGINIGKREGVHLDDGFYIIEIEENSEGLEIEKRKGFARVIKTGDNVNNSNNLTYIKQVMGSKVSEGSLILEHPRLGIQTNFSFGTVSGVSIKPKHTSLYNEENLISKNISALFNSNFTFSYNLAPIINLTQTFLDMELGISIPTNTFSDHAIDDPLALFSSVYVNLIKRFGGRVFGGIKVGNGLDFMSVTDSTNDLNFSCDITTYGMKTGAEVGFIIKPDILITLNTEYKYSFLPHRVNFNYNGEEFEKEINNEYDDFSLGGLSINIKFIYELRELPINIFGSLDTFKKY